MTFWADNIKFIKDVLDSKYKKIEDALADVSFLFVCFEIVFKSRYLGVVVLFLHLHMRSSEIIWAQILAMIG